MRSEKIEARYGEDWQIPDVLRTSDGLWVDPCGEGGWTTPELLRGATAYLLTDVPPEPPEPSDCPRCSVIRGFVLGERAARAYARALRSAVQGQPQTDLLDHKSFALWLIQMHPKERTKDLRKIKELLSSPIETPLGLLRDFQWQNRRFSCVRQVAGRPDACVEGPESCFATARKELARREKSK